MEKEERASQVGTMQADTGRQEQVLMDQERVMWLQYMWTWDDKEQGRGRP